MAITIKKEQKIIEKAKKAFAENEDEIEEQISKEFEDWGDYGTAMNRCIQANWNGKRWRIFERDANTWEPESDLIELRANLGENRHCSEGLHDEGCHFTFEHDIYDEELDEDGDCLNCVDYKDWKQDQVEAIYEELKKDLDDNEFEVNLDDDE